MAAKNPIFKTAPYLVFPTLMGGALASTYLQMHWGTQPATAALISVLIFGFAAIPVLERLLPYRPQWNQNDSDLKPDIIYMVFNAFIPRLWTPVQIFALTAITAWLGTQLDTQLWPQDWPLLVDLFLMLLIAEFGRYWVHFAAHKTDWLWRLHAVHHSPNRLYFLNANRFHPLEKLIFQIPEVAPFVLLGTPVEVIAMYFTFNGIHGLTQHSNIHIKGGVLNYVFSLTELHRWHHSQKIEESDRNFGNNLIVWDMVFGTFFHPKNREVETIGLLNPEYPKTVSGQLVAPFAKRDISKPEGWQK
ncbi:MAG: sterol desaturase family protein [Gammaproteobacteria bacterium]|nr:sterol desaturase family protein [Gammaproteobacteria bacterium]